MTYRKIKKAYARRFGCVFYIKLSKHGKSCMKKSKAFTAFKMKKALYTNRPYLGIIGSRIKAKHHE